MEDGEAGRQEAGLQLSSQRGPARLRASLLKAAYMPILCDHCFFVSFFLVVAWVGEGASVKCRQTLSSLPCTVRAFLFTASFSKEGLIDFLSLAFKILGKFSGWSSLAEVLSRDQAAAVMGT